MRRITLALCAVLVSSVPAAHADIVGVVPTRLIVIDRTVASGRAKAIFVARDAAAHKGTGADVATISAQLDVAWGTTRGAFVMPAGAHNGTRGWVTIRATSRST